MNLADRCGDEFDKGVRTRGEKYVREKRVTFDALNVRGAVASVTGEGNYAVVLDWSSSADDILYASCSCPYFDDHCICKHLWAVLREIDARDGGPPGENKLEIIPIEPDEGDSELDGVDNFDSDRDFLPTVSKSGSPPSRIGKTDVAKSNERDASVGKSETMPRPKPPAWQKQLAATVSSNEPISTTLRRASTSAKQREIWYVLDMDMSLELGAPVLRFFQRELKTEGKVGRLKRFGLRLEEIDDLGDILDREILTILLSCGDAQSEFGYYYRNSAKIYDLRLPENLTDVLLPLIGSTQRFAWLPAGIDHITFEKLRPLAWDDGPSWKFRLEIQSDETRRCWSLGGQLYREGSDVTVPLEKPVMVAFQGFVLFDDSIAAFESGKAAKLVEALRKNPTVEVPFKDRWELIRHLWQLPYEPEARLPDNLVCETVEVPPQGRLMVDKPDRYDPYRLPARIDFLYDGKSVRPEESARGIIDDAKGRVMIRDRARERELAASLAARGVRPSEGWQAEKYNVWLSSQSLPQVVDSLIGEGWIVEAQGYHFRRAASWQMNVTSGVDWFDLNGSMDFGGIEAKLPEILEALREGQNYVRLTDGTRGLLPKDWLSRFATMADLGQAEGDAIRFRSSQALLLDALLAAQEQVSLDATFTELRNKLSNFSGVAPADEPEGFIGELRHYQKHGLGWLQFLRDFRLGGCLADDMGLGKTVQVLALLESRRNRPVDADGHRAPTLVVVPRSLVFNWVEEATRFTPNLRVLDYTGPQRTYLSKVLHDYDMVITTYGTLQRDIVKIKDLRFDYAILDESQAIKNAASQRAKACRLIKAEHRLAMTGTPVENHLGELWSLLEFLNPGILGKASVFQGISKKVAEDGESLGLLRRALGPFILRRTKKQVLTELPQKTEQTLHCDLEGKQRKRYDELRMYFRAALTERIAKTGLAKSKIHVLEALLRLRQAAIHPGLIDKSAVDEPSAKLDVLLEQLREIVEEGHKALVFSQFTSFLAIVRDRLDKEKMVYEYLDGRTRDRQERVDRFQNDPNCPLFLISLKAGGQGLNLTAADYVFILDPWWNPAVEAQAIDRAHRIGQERHVFAYRLIARDTVEEKIVELQRTKRDLAEAIISADGNVLGKLTAEDLELLLS